MAKDNKEFETRDLCIVKSHDVMLDAEYAEWIAEVKHRYRSAQVKAAVKVNGENLSQNSNGLSEKLCTKLVQKCRMHGNSSERT